MKRILIFGMTDNLGGVETMIMNYYDNIDRNKIQFDFLCNTEQVAYKNKIESLGGKIFRITARSKNIKLYKKEMKDFFKKNANKYSTIWVNVCSLANIDYLKLAKKYGIKYRIIHSHNSQNMDSKLREVLHKINKLFIKKYATDFWACSETAGKWFYSKKIRESDKYILINNAIDTQKYMFNEKIRKEIRKELNIEDKLVIGNIGRFHFQKNHKFIIDIFNELYKKNNNAHLLLIGQGEDEEGIKNKVKRLGIEENVNFLGLRNDIPQLLQAMDVFLFPSLFEGLPLVLVEAQASGIDIYTSKEGVSEKAKMTDNFYFLSLNESAEKWADNILKNNHIRECSKKNAENIKKIGYDIRNETRKIEKFLIRD